MIKIVIEARLTKCSGGCRRRRINVNIAEVIVKDVNGIAGDGANWRIAIVEATGFQFGKNFGEKTRFCIYAQHT